MTSTIALAFSFFLFLLAFPQGVYAKRLLPRARPKTGTQTVVRATRGVNTSVKFRADRRAIIVTFSNLGISSSIDYKLSYSTRGTIQGAGGTISLSSEDPTLREIIFGTCSRGVCRYDSGITNARFLVTTTLKSGLKVVKPFRLRV